MSDKERTPDPDTQPASVAPSTKDLVNELKRNLEKTRLPANLRDEILADLPPPEERERLFRELQENGGLSSEEFLASLGLEGNGNR